MQKIEMLKKTITFLVYSAIFYSLIVISSSYFPWNTKEEETAQTTQFELRSAPRSKLAQVSVAISTNIGIRYKERGKTVSNSEFQGGLDNITDVVWNNIEMNKTILTQNMLFIQEYLNLLKTNVVWLLNASNNRETTLNDFISQLEIRYKSSQTNITKLNNYKTTLEWLMVEADNKTNTLKDKISADFSWFKDLETWANIGEYLDLKNDYIYARTYLIFVNKFLVQYDFLNNYNKKLLDTLINNKDALSKKSFIVIPDSGDSLLKDMNLLFDEDVYKNELNKTEEK